MFVALVVGAILIGAKLIQFDRVTVHEFERGLRYDKGRFTGLVEPGAYRVLRRNSRIETVDIRPQAMPIPGQEVITADGVSIRISLAAQYAIADPDIAVNQHQNAYAAMYLELQVALREIVSAALVDDLLAGRATIGPRITEAVREKVALLGLRLDFVEAKDLMFPGDLRKAFAQTVTARKEGQAALERARGETAALRHLANAARLLEANPALMQLRVVQQIGGTSGNTVVLGLSGSGTPVPVRTPPEEIEAGETPPTDE